MENNNEKVSYLDLKALMKEARRKEKQKKRSQKAEKVKDWISEHKAIILAATPIVAGAITGTVKATTGLVRTISRKSDLRKEQNLKDLYCYDRHSGHYWRLNRKLNNSEWMTIERRKGSGETLAEILHDMNVLKK